ncbi:MAG: hypothetical protein WDO73_09460 [Ignavibacteriota bacterium]
MPTFLENLMGKADEIVREALVTYGGEAVHAKVRELMGLGAPQAV